jgi:hypothetical protein
MGTDSGELLLRTVEMYWAEIHHIEEQREKHVNIVLLVSTAILGLVFQDGLLAKEWPFVAVVILLGVYGMVFVQKMFERYCHMQTRKDYVYEAFDKMYPDCGYMDLRRKANSDHFSKFWIFSRVKVNLLWQVIPFGIVCFGTCILLKMLNVF